MSEVARVSLSLDDGLLASLDAMVSAGNYGNRSEFIRDLVRERLTREAWEAGDEVIGVLTVIYNHHRRGLTEKLVELQHHCGETILAATHVHLSHEICAEMIMIRGRGRGIGQFADAVKRERGVLHAALSMSTTGSEIH